MLYSALVIMLGHNFIEHHHHDFEHNEESHHHHDGHHHDNNNDTEDQSDDLSHLFSSIQHGVEGLTFLSSHCTSDNLSKQISQITSPLKSNFIFNPKIIEDRQNGPPYTDFYDNSQNSLPSGLRAPPIYIV